MSESITVQGTVLADGSLQLNAPLPLPPGPVEVIVRSVSPADRREDVLAVLARIRAEQQARGHVPRTVEQIDAEIDQMRNEWEERQKAIEDLQAECQRARQSSASTDQQP